MKISLSNKPTHRAEFWPATDDAPEFIMEFDADNNHQCTAVMHLQAVWLDRPLHCVNFCNLEEPKDANSPTNPSA